MYFATLQELYQELYIVKIYTKKDIGIVFDKTRLLLYVNYIIVFFWSITVLSLKIL